MPEFSSIDIAYSFNGYLLLLGLVIFALTSYFVYKYTVPQTSTLIKVFLGFVRTAALFVLLLAIFEPVITFFTKSEITLVNYVVIDNSSSMILKDSTSRAEKIKSISEELKNSFGNIQFLLFGDSVRAINDLSDITFKDKTTNIEKVFEFISGQNSSTASLTIISDGILNNGGTPLYAAEQGGFPVYTTGIGDTSAIKDVSISKVAYNAITYVDNSSPVIVSIKNTGFAGKKITVELFEENRSIGIKTLELSKSGLDKTEFYYTPAKSGTKRLFVTTSVLPEEENKENNKNVFFIEVRDNKLNLLIISGSPSSDLSFVKNAVASDKNYDVTLFTRINNDKVIGGENLAGKLDSADVIFFIGYPHRNSPESEIKMINQTVAKNKTPVMFLLSTATDIAKLKTLEKLLPVSISSVKSGFTQVQPEIIAPQSSLLGNNASDPVIAWNNLPPVHKTNSTFTQKPGAAIISKIKIKGIPDEGILIASEDIPGKRSIIVTASEIWRWKLLRTRENDEILDSFINNSLKWLTIPEDKKQVTIKTVKKVFSAGETVDISAQVYDEAFNPVNNAEIKVEVTGNQDNLVTTLSATQNGLYSGEINVTRPGYYNFSGTATRAGQSLGKDNGSFSIGEVNAEKETTVMNVNFLRRLSIISGGKYIPAENINELMQEIKLSNSGMRIFSTGTIELKLWSEEWLLYILIILFTIEWFFRKRNGML